MLMGRKGENYPTLELGEGTNDIPNGHFLDPFLFDLSAAFGHFFLSFSLSPYGPQAPWGSSNTLPMFPPQHL